MLKHTVIFFDHFRQDIKCKVTDRCRMYMQMLWHTGCGLDSTWGTQLIKYLHTTEDSSQML